MFPKITKIKEWLKDQLDRNTKKIKHLNHTMIVLFEDNKYKNRRNDDYIIPPRKFYNELQGGDVIVEWKDDLKFVSKLDRLLSDGKSLTKKELEYCNTLYEFYSEVYETVIDCLKHDNPLINKKLKEVSVEEGRIIHKNYFRYLTKEGTELGFPIKWELDYAVVNVIEPLVLINPKIIHKEFPIDYFEGCLSYPKKGTPTKRYKDIIYNAQERWLVF